MIIQILLNVIFITKLIRNILCMIIDLKVFKKMYNSNPEIFIFDIILLILINIKPPIAILAIIFSILDMLWNMFRLILLYKADNNNMEPIQESTIIYSREIGIFWDILLMILSSFFLFGIIGPICIFVLIIMSIIYIQKL